MQRLQQHTPELKAIQAKYKDDKQRQQQEMMKFYKENQINPFGACLPLAAQLPVFISLFYLLRSSLRKDICPSVQLAAHTAHHVALGSTVPCTQYGPFPKAQFLFIPDLTNKATGAVLIVLILLYVGTQLASSLMMSSPTMDQTQRRLMLLMPLFFVVFIIRFPAGVIVYWITTNSWTILQQYVVRKRLGPLGPPATATASDDDAARGPSSRAKAPPEPAGNGAGSGGGLSGLLRGRLKPAEEPAAVGSSGGTRGGSRSSARGGPPPPPPRKKKKRSGRRR